MHERTKKNVLIVLALAGFALTFAVLVRIAWRYGGGDAIGAGRTWTAILEQTVSFEKILFLRPGKSSLEGIRIKNETRDETFIYIPKLISTARKTLPSREEIFALFPGQNRYQVFQTPQSPFQELEAQKIEDESDFPADSSSGFRNVCLSSTSFIDKIPENAQNCVFWDIPELNVRQSELERISSFFFDWLTRHCKEGELVFFSIKRINIINSDVDFNELVRTGQSVQSEDESESSIRTGSTESGKASSSSSTDNSPWLQDGVEVSHEVTCRWLRDFNNRRAITRLLNVEGMFFSQGHRNCLDLGFVFEGIPAPRLYDLSVYREYSEPGVGRTWFSLNTNGSPFPTSFAAHFNPIFLPARDEGWFCGILAGEFLQKKKKPASNWVFNDFHLYQCDFEPFALKATSISMKGTLVDFYLQRGTIRNGIFTGNGDVFLSNGTLDKTFLTRLRESLLLTFDPVNTLSNRFANNDIPYNELAFSFSMRQKGVTFDSKYRQKIIGFYRQDGFEYRLYLPEDAPKRLIPYPQLLAVLAAPDGSTPFWSEFYRDAINHLPVDK